MKPGQGGTTQSIKTSAQAIQLQQIPQSGTIQATLPQQILLRPTTQSATGQPHFQGIIEKIDFSINSKLWSFFCLFLFFVFFFAFCCCCFVLLVYWSFGTVVSWFVLFFQNAMES